MPSHPPWGFFPFGPETLYIPGMPPPADTLEGDDYRPHHTHSDSEELEAESGSGEEPNPRPRTYKPGMKGEVKKLYEATKKCHNCPRWVDKLQKESADALYASKDIQQYAVIVHYKRTPTDKGELKIHSLVVQSPLLCPLLEDVFKNFPGVTALERLKFFPPFVPFFHRWQKFQNARWAVSGDIRAHADLIHEALQPSIEADGKASSEMIARGVISFDLLWTLFVPGELVACNVGGHDLVCTVSRAEYFKCKETTDDGFIITCRYIDSSRSGLGLAVMTLTLPRFSGTVSISELSFKDLRQESQNFSGVLVMPARLRPDLAALKTRLIQRGRKFEALQGVHYKRYIGDYDEVYQGQRGMMLVRRKITSRVIIDVESFESHAHPANINLLPLDASAEPQGDELLDKFRDEFVGADGGPMEDRIADFLGRKSANGRVSKLSDDQLLLCSPKVRGYNLKPQSWAEFFVDNIQDVVFDSDAFSNVVLPSKYKSLITTFVSHYISDRASADTFDDIVPGKGKSVIILLSGDPGIGKTLTAETIADVTKAPLVGLAASELGSLSDDIERNLDTVLRLCTRWHAILLLDEADVFLQRRNILDMERHKIVSVFLRALEYHEGLMFMTTNRVTSIDPAFKSRVHVNLNYPPLDKNARARIWMNFLKRRIANANTNNSGGGSSSSSSSDNMGGVAITQDQVINILSERQMNGREIKNTVKIAGLLADARGEKLSMEHINSVLEVNGSAPDGDDGDSGTGDIGGYVLENDFRVC